MKKWYAMMICPLLTIAAGALEGNAQEAAQKTRTLLAARTNVAPIIDGRGDDRCWKDASKATGFSIYSKATELHREQTVGRVCFDDENLYLFVECKVGNIERFRAEVAETKGEFQYSKAGVIEVFLDTNCDRKTFTQHLIHANGSSLIALTSRDILKTLTDDVLDVAAVATETGYNVEVALPLAVLGLRSDTNPKTWGFNLNRCHALLVDGTNEHDKMYSSWNSTGGRGFQDSSLFGYLNIENDFSPYFWDVTMLREPQAGDSTVDFRVVNETGKDFSGELSLTITTPGEKASSYRQAVSLPAGGKQVVSFKHRVSAPQVEAKYNVVLTDATGRDRYLGGTQKVDLATRDPWAPPSPVADETARGFVIYRRPYTQPMTHRSVPRADERLNQLGLKACRGEFEPITFALYPLRDVEEVAVSVSDLKGPKGGTIPSSAVKVGKVTFQSLWKNSKLFETWEHLVRTFDRLQLVSGNSRRLWLTVEVPKDATTGLYRGKVSISTGQMTAYVPLEVEVLPFELSAPDGMGYFMYYYGPQQLNKAFGTAEYLKTSVKDMRDHGMTTYTIYHGAQVTDAETGKPRIDVDKYIPWNVNVTYAQLIDILRAGGLGLSAPLIDVYTWYYKPEITLALYRVYRSRGWPEVLCYIGDEIDSPERIAPARKIVEGIKKIAPGIKTTTTLGRSGVKALGHLYDVWINCNTPEMVKKCLGMGKQPWTYSCRQIHEVTPAFERYFFGQHAWNLGLRGVGLWCYAENNMFKDRFGFVHAYTPDLEFRSDWKHLHGHVVFENGRPIPTVTWEAVREGIDDYRYMLTLRKASEAVVKGNSPKAREAGRAGLEMLKRIKADANWELGANDKKYGRAWELLPDMGTTRRQVIAAILKIRDASPAETTR